MISIYYICEYCDNMASLPENMALDDSKMKEFKETVKSYKKKAKVKTAEREDK